MLEKNLKFGVEIEFFNVNVNKVIEVLRQQGIQVADFEGYTHNVISSWKITTDSSVNNTNTGVRCGLELVSPILYGDDGLDELEKVYEVLNSLQAKVDRSCGTHIHFDIAEFNTNNVKNLVNLYYNFQTTINMLLPKSRRKCSWCKQLNSYEVNTIKDRCTTINEISNTIGTRYSVINLESYVKYGTVEFRQHGGTLDFNKIEAWIILMYQILNTALNNNIQIGKVTQCYNGFYNFMEITNLNNTYTGDYLLERYTAFKEAL